MYHIILLAALAVLGSCWPISEPEHVSRFNTARDSQSAGLSIPNSSVIETRTIALSREINTTLAGLIFVATLATYWLLMKYTVKLSDEIIFPSKLIEDNMAAALLSQKVWPKYVKECLETNDSETNLFLLRQTPLARENGHLIEGVEEIERQQTRGPLYELQGYGDLLEGRPENMKTPPITTNSVAPIKTFSPVIRFLVQIAIWNSVSFWIVLVMLFNTLIYNGFGSNSITNDGIIRVVFVVVYTFANFGNQVYTTILLYRNFTYAVFQGCLVLICKKFIFTASELRHDDTRSRLGCSYSLELFGPAERSNCYRQLLKPGHTLENYDPNRNDVSVLPVFVMKFVQRIKENPNNDDALIRDIPSRYLPRISEHGLLQFVTKKDKTECQFDKSAKPLREAEIKAYEKSTESVLERTLANVAVLIGICLSTALAPWTSSRTSDPTNAQLGSYALLLSISTGLLALVSGITQLSNATESARTILLLQEKTVAAGNSDTESVLDLRFSSGTGPKNSFSKGIKGQSQLTFFGLWQLTNLQGKLLCVIFGPALLLIPRFHQLLNKKDNDGYLVLNLDDHKLIYNTDSQEMYKVNPELADPAPSLDAPQE
ncbi:hypothetical protein F4821DRAFT_248397 [Hypoxylon rubiginosum]|uniref:Uncharacterized protein n=1 Tax=Hypoxylon rubiginosum TaxID=110542 RepID=A0ACC0CNC6_9PEZI|nr:hypothetical protein F4821DRAFT_248397 [Hypoxylon rubiginosum]